MMMTCKIGAWMVPSQHSSYLIKDQSIALESQSRNANGYWEWTQLHKQCHEPHYSSLSAGNLSCTLSLLDFLVWSPHSHQGSTADIGRSLVNHHGHTVALHGYVASTILGSRVFWSTDTRLIRNRKTWWAQKATQRLRNASTRQPAGSQGDGWGRTGHGPYGSRTR